MKTAFRLPVEAVLRIRVCNRMLLSNAGSTGRLRGFESRSAQTLQMRKHGLMDRHLNFSGRCELEVEAGQIAGLPRPLCEEGHQVGSERISLIATQSLPKRDQFLT